MSQKFVLLVAFLFFFLSGVFLFWKNEIALNPDTHKSWWVIYFVDPQDSASLAFSIENHTPTDSFQFIVRTTESILMEQTISVPTGTTVTLPVVTPTNPQGEASVLVTHDSETRIIYR